MFLDEVTPDTSVYMIAGYAIFFLITAIYLLSLFVRTRNLRRDLESLEGMEQEPELAPAVPVRTPAPARARPPSAKSSKAAQSKQTRKKAARKK